MNITACFTILLLSTTFLTKSAAFNPDLLLKLISKLTPVLAQVPLNMGILAFMNSISSL